jgi:hypothetical protein
MKIPSLALAGVAARRPTAVYDLYWRFAAERQAIFFRRLERAPYPWTDDAILQTYRFTNAYRASDRVSQYLIQHVIYGEHYPKSPKEILFRILLFKLFNKESTWKLLEAGVGPLTWQTFSADNYDRVLSAATRQGTRIYSAAYIIPPVALDRSKVKHRGHLRLIELMLQGDLVSRLQDSRDLREVFLLLKSYPSLGDFLAFQLAIDLNYSPLIDHQEANFVVPGPGARDGLAKTFPNASPEDAESLIALMMERQEAEFARLDLNFRSIWGRRLQLIDCQNLFCEVSKYTRVSHPQIGGLSGRTRIKQTFKPLGPPYQPWYPPKWAINDQIPTYTKDPTPDLFTAVP